LNYIATTSSSQQTNLLPLFPRLWLLLVGLVLEQLTAGLNGLVLPKDGRRSHFGQASCYSLPSIIQPCSSKQARKATRSYPYSMQLTNTARHQDAGTFRIEFRSIFTQAWAYVATPAQQKHSLQGSGAPKPATTSQTMQRALGYGVGFLASSGTLSSKHLFGSSPTQSYFMP
jgi:hypothetical protein